MPVAGRVDAVAVLRVGVQRKFRRARARHFFDVHRERVAADDGLLAREFVGFETARLDELRESRELALVFAGITRLTGTDRLDRLRGGRFVAASDHRLPRGNSDTDQQRDNRDHDHQLDKVETCLIFINAA